MGFFTNHNQKQDQPVQMTPVKMGLVLGAMAGAVIMMIAGGLGFTTFADIALLVGITLGAGVGYIYDAQHKKKAEEEKKIK